MPQNKTVDWDYTMVCVGKYIYLIKEKGGGLQTTAERETALRKTKY